MGVTGTVSVWKMDVPSESVSHPSSSRQSFSGSGEELESILSVIWPGQGTDRTALRSVTGAANRTREQMTPTFEPLVNLESMVNINVNSGNLHDLDFWTDLVGPVPRWKDKGFSQSQILWDCLRNSTEHLEKSQAYNSQIQYKKSRELNQQFVTFLYQQFVNSSVCLLLWFCVIHDHISLWIKSVLFKLSKPSKISHLMV